LSALAEQWEKRESHSTTADEQNGEVQR
jgi:hypothetical protein